MLPVFPLFGDGSTRMQPVHVEDVAAAVARILADRSFDGRVFELGGTVVAYRALLERIAARLGLRRRYLRIPFGLWWLLAACAAPLPRPPITPAQIALMERDNVVAPDAEGFAELGVQPRALEEELGSLIC